MCSSLKNIAIKGLSVCVPKQTEKTMDYDWITIEERTSFEKNTGIKERRVASKHITTADMCEKSASELIQKLNWEKDSIDVLIFVSQSPDYFLPATSAILQHKLGLKNNIIAFDINLGCSGYVYGLHVLSSLMAGGLKRGLLLAGDKSTLSTNYKDKSTYPLFGDAGSATALEFDATAMPIYFNLFTDGSGYKSIIIEDGGARNHISSSSFVEEKITEGIERAPKHLTLDGIEIFNFALKEVVPSIKQLFQFSEIDESLVDYYVFHQANKLINESVRKKARVDVNKVPYSIEKFGNTSSASIPLTLLYQLKNELEEKELMLLLSGFGVGYSWGNCLLQTKKITCTDILEIE